MGTLDKRKPLSPDALTRKAYVVIVLRKPHEGGPPEVARCFTNLGKATDYIETIGSEGIRYAYWSERWRVM